MREDENVQDEQNRACRLRLCRDGDARSVCSRPSHPAADAGSDSSGCHQQWYLRGDIGYSNQRVDELDNALYDTVESLDEGDREFTGAPFAGVGLGYQWNRWFRTDVPASIVPSRSSTGRYLHRLQRRWRSGHPTDSYFAKKSEWVGLVNAYVDLGSWHGITPFVGAGIGAANVEISNFTDIGVGVDGSPSIAYGDENNEWNLAWALHAGVGFDVTEQFTMELAYRYLHLGDGASGDLVAYDGTNNFDNPMEFEDISSHDVRLGMRYKFF
jgi:opacity protein-like surface antigen